MWKNSEIKSCIVPPAVFSSSRAMRLVVSPGLPRQIVIFVLSFLVAALVFFLTLNGWFILALFFFASLFLAWRNINMSIFLLIVSLFVSPKINLLPISSEPFFIRFDDLLLAAICFVNFLRIKPAELSPLDSPLDVPLWSFVIIVILSVIQGILRTTAQNPVVSLSYLFKTVEYLFVFYLVYFYTRNRKDLWYFLIAGLLGVVLISIYGIFEHFHPLLQLPYPVLYRIYERGFFSGQANHLAGTLAFYIALLSGVILFVDDVRSRIVVAFSVLLLFYPLCWTYSRQAEVSLVFSLIVLGLLGLRRVRLHAKLVFFFLVLVALLIVASSPFIKERILMIGRTMTSDDIYQSSFASRLYRWKTVWTDTRDFLLLGTGLGSRHRVFYESQWVMYLSETGLAGILMFSWLLLRILRLSYRTFVHTQEARYKGVVAGFIAGLAGLIIQGFVCAVFTVTVIAGPFYVMAALIMAEARNRKDEKQST